MKNILLHICCGVCASSAVEVLREENFEVTGFFYNPNIYPPSEYKERWDVAREVSHLLKFKLVEGIYDGDNWFKLTKGLEAEQEGALRCEVCFKMRLEQTFKKCEELGFVFFTTTLTVSPHKNSSVINRIGREFSQNFLERDFKKKDGFKKAIDFATRNTLYQQNYCGCVYSLR